MALNPREKKLAATVAALVALLAVWVVAGRIGQAFRGRESQIDALNLELQRKQIRVGQMALRLESYFEWERRALPRNAELARSLYQNWLVSTLADAKLGNVQVDPGRATQLRDVYFKVPFTVRAQGSLEEVAAWLAKFYEVDHLQQIRELTLQPLGRAGDLQLTATIEALSLPEADRTDKLTELSGGRLDEATAKSVMKTITERNLFAAYVPPPPPRPTTPFVRTPPPPPPKPTFDESKYTFLTSIVSADDLPEAWLMVRPTKTLLRLHAGDEIHVGQFSGTLVRIGDKEIEVETDGKRRVVALGKALTESS